MSLPAADDLFRPTAPPVDPTEPTDEGEELSAAHPTEPEGLSVDARPSGRVRHDEKITIYVTADELLAIEQARLALRRFHGQGVDRGRLVREAVAIALADLDQNGADSVLVQRLIGP